MPASHGIDFHPEFQHTYAVDWGLTPHYPLMAVKANEGAHVARYEDQSGRDFRILRQRKEQGLHTFVMLYFFLIGGQSVADQVANFRRFVKKYLGRFEQGEGYQLDWETIGYSPFATSTMAKEFVDRMLQLDGVEGITYGAEWLPDSPLDADLRKEFYEWREENPNRALWYPIYNLTTGPATIEKWKADVWQWTSSARVPGWPTTVDMNEITGKGWDTLRRICRIPPAPSPEPLPPPPTGEDTTMNVIVAPRGCAARFLGTSDGKGYISSMTWIPTEEARKRLPYAEQVVEISDCRNIGLIGPVPRNDPGRAWTLADFLNATG